MEYAAEIRERCIIGKSIIGEIEVMSLCKQIEQNRRKAVIHLLEMRKVSNPENVEKVKEGLYKHTNTRGRIKVFKVYNTFDAYLKSSDYPDGRMQSVNGFKIVDKAED